MRGLGRSGLFFIFLSQGFLDEASAPVKKGLSNPGRESPVGKTTSNSHGP